MLKDSNSRLHLQGACKLNCEANYDASLMENALLALHEIKQEICSKNFHKADMWCHFGTVVIHDPDEGRYPEFSRYLVCT